MKKSSLKELKELENQLAEKIAQLASVDEHNESAMKKFKEIAIKTLVEELTSKHPDEILFNQKEYFDRADTKEYSSFSFPELYLDYHYERKGFDSYSLVKPERNLDNNSPNYHISFSIKVPNYMVKDKPNFLSRNELVNEIKTLEEKIAPYHLVLQKEKELEEALSKL